MIDTQQKLRLSDYQIEVQKQIIRKAELTKEELKQQNPDTPTYQGVGRM